MEFERKIIKTHQIRNVEIHETVTMEWTNWQYSENRTWQPTAIRMTFISDSFDGGDWSPWILSGPVRVFGHNIKADGSRGADRDESHWGHREGPFASHVRDILAELNAAADMPSPYSGDAVPLA
jgi:hypothetical protein